MNSAESPEAGRGGRVVVQAATRSKRRSFVQAWSADTQFRVVGWLGLVLTLAALSDYALTLYPWGLGSPEWEMATIGAVVQGLPLFSIGLAGMWVCAGGLGRRWLLITVGWGLLVVAVGMLVSLVLFVTDVPLALRATEDVARVGIYKLVGRTTFMGLLFALSYMVAGVLALKQVRRREA